LARERRYEYEFMRSRMRTGDSSSFEARKRAARPMSYVGEGA